jgi:integrase
MENDVGIYEVQKWLGHSSINSTKIYAKITSIKMDNTASRLDNLYNIAT